MLKVALVLGVQVYAGVEFGEIIEPTDEHGWRATFNPPNDETLSKLDYDVMVGADGKKNVLPGFQQTELRGSLAIGITCNFINNNTPEETSCKEISGIAYQFKPAFFDELKAKHGVDLENFVYYKNDTHYFVMTARKQSLLARGVLLKDEVDPALLVQSSNINKAQLEAYTRDAIRYATTLPESTEFKKLANGQPDIALFDFTSLKKAENASRIIERRKHKLLLALVGDSLIEPFWPTGSGCGRGVLSALDVAWMVRQFALKYPPLAMLRERQNVFKLLSASTHDNIQKNHSAYTINPSTRYSALDTRKVTNLDFITSLYDTDDASADLTLSSPSLTQKSYFKKKTPVDRRKSNSGTASRTSGRTVAGKNKRKLERQESRHRQEEKKLSIKDATNFFEEHHKKMGSTTDVPRPKRTTVASEDFSGLEGIHEDINESDDDVMIDEEPEKPAESRSTLRQRSKESGSKTKKVPGKDSMKRQASRSLKRQSSKDTLSESTANEEDVPVVKRKTFSAKGGGLKSKMRHDSKKSLSEKSDTTTTKSRHKSTDKKSTSVNKRKSRKSAGSVSDVDVSRYSNFDSINNDSIDSKSSLRSSSRIEKRIMNRKGEMPEKNLRKVSTGSIVKRKSLSKKHDSAIEKTTGRSKIHEYIKLFEENCSGSTSKLLSDSRTSSKYSSRRSSSSSITKVTSFSQVSTISGNLLNNVKKIGNGDNTLKVPSNTSFKSDLSNTLNSHGSSSQTSDICTLLCSSEISCDTEYNKLPNHPSVSGTSVPQVDHSDIDLNNVSKSAFVDEISAIELNQNSIVDHSSTNTNVQRLDSISSSVAQNDLGRVNDVSVMSKNCVEQSVLVDNNDITEDITANHASEVDVTASGLNLKEAADTVAGSANEVEEATPLKNRTKLRRSTSIRRSKFKPLQQKPKDKFIQPDIVDVKKKTQPDASKVIKRNNSRKTEGSMSTISKGIKTKGKARRVSQDVRRKNMKPLSDFSSDTSSISISSIDEIRKQDPKTRRSDSINTKPLIKKSRSNVRTSNIDQMDSVKPSIKKTTVVSSTKPIVQRTQVETVAKRTRSSSRLSTAKHSTTRNTAKSNMDADNGKKSLKEKDISGIKIMITDDRNNSHFLETDSLDLGQDTFSSEASSINYDAKHSPVLKRSKKRRNVRNTSAVKRKHSNVASPSVQLSQRRNGKRREREVVAKKCLPSESDSTDSVFSTISQISIDTTISGLETTEQVTKQLRFEDDYPETKRQKTNVSSDSINDTKTKPFNSANDSRSFNYVNDSEVNSFNSVNISQTRSFHFVDNSQIDNSVKNIDSQIDNLAKEVDSRIDDSSKNVLGIPENSEHQPSMDSSLNPHGKENIDVSITKKKGPTSSKRKTPYKTLGRDQRICPLGKLSPKQPIMSKAIGKFLSEKDVKRRNSSVLDSIMEEDWV